MTDPLGALMIMAGAAMMRPAKGTIPTGLQSAQMHSIFERVFPAEDTGHFKSKTERKLKSVK